jgi:hypothetical protein
MEEINGDDFCLTGLRFLLIIWYKEGRAGTLFSVGGGGGALYFLSITSYGIYVCSCLKLKHIAGQGPLDAYVCT